MKVPLLDLKSQYDTLREEIMHAIAEVIDTQCFILGSQVSEFEERVAEYCDTRYAIGVSSGTDALLVSLMASGVGAGDEVVTTAYSFFATAGCISRVGAKPVFVDIDPDTYNLDPAHVEAAITRRTKAIIPVHLYGQSADMDPILQIADQHGLPVIEDAAQSIGAQYRDGRVTGSMGALGCLSFFPSKNLGGAGDGGMIVTNDAVLAERVRVLRVHGSKPKYYHNVIGGNFRLDTIQAAVLNVKLNYLNQWTRQRQEHARKYAELFAASDMATDEIQLPKAVYANSGVERYHVFNQYVIRTRERDALCERLTHAGVGTAIYYPVPFHLQGCFTKLGYQPGEFPEAERAAKETLAIPVFPELSPQQQAAVVEAVCEHSVAV